MIVISNPIAIADEISLIHALFEEGLAVFQVRKPGFSEIEMAKFIHQIRHEFRSKLALHSHHQIAADFGINRIHFTEKQRKESLRISLENKTISTSVHSVEYFNSLTPNFEYAFLSPVFKSISKENYSPEIDLFKALKSRTNFKTKVVALGGIDSENIRKALEKGFDDIALLGAVWNHENPLKQFKLCQKIVHTHSL
ncbi:MAG: thiamine phosphate synthase [Flavobacterium sp.]